MIHAAAATVAAVVVVVGGRAGSGRHLLLQPHFAHQRREFSGQFPPRPQGIVGVQILPVLPAQEVLPQRWRVRQTLQRGVHEAGVAQIAEAGGTPAALDHCGVSGGGGGGVESTIGIIIARRGDDWFGGISIPRLLQHAIDIVLVVVPHHRRRRRRGQRWGQENHGWCIISTASSAVTDVTAATAIAVEHCNTAATVATTRSSSGSTATILLPRLLLLLFLLHLFLLRLGTGHGSNVVVVVIVITTATATATATTATTFRSGG